jgi:hydrophobe/amphiphile efflux-1 (HAE1) family protein
MGLNSLIDLAIRRSVLGWTLFIAVLLFGILGFRRLGVSQLPDVDFPVLNITITQEGASPQVIESELLDPIEERLLVIEGVEEMRSSARQGSGTITLNLSLNRDVNVALNEVQTALSSFRLPLGVDPPIIRKQNPEEDPILILSVTGKREIKDLIHWTDTQFMDQIRFLEGVGEVSIGGFSERNLRIWFDAKRLRDFELTISDVLEAIRSQHLESAAGQYVEGKEEVRVRWQGEAPTPKEVAEIQILKRGSNLIYGRTIRVRDVARVEDGLSDIRRMARVDGAPAVSIIVRKQRGTHEVEVAHRVIQKITAMRAQIPSDLKTQINIDFTRSTQATVTLTLEKLLLASVVTILICFFFLGNLQSAFNILLAIPFSVLGTFLILSFLKFTLNTFTLLALTLAVSIVVDDAILILENIVRHRQQGKSALAAASEGAKEILPAALASTLAVLAIFLPVAFMKGVIGKFFYQFGVTMGIAVSLSLLEALLLTPMRTRALLEDSGEVGTKSGLRLWMESFESRLEHVFARISEGYRRLLRQSLKYKWVIVLSSVALFGISLGLVRSLRQEYVPSQDQDLLILSAQTAPGSSLEATDQKAKEIEAILAKAPEIEGYFASIGAGGPSAQVNQIFLPIRLKPREQRRMNHVQIQALLRKQFKENLKGVRVQLRDLSARNLSTGRQNPVSFNIRGPEIPTLKAKAEELIHRLEKEGLAIELDMDFKEGIPELVLTPNRQILAERGISIEAVSQLLAAGVGGLRQGRITSDGRRMDIRFKFEENQMSSEKDLKNLYLRAASGDLVPLSTLVTATRQKTLLNINRLNRARSISVFGNLAPGTSQAKVLGRAEALALEILPTGYTFALEGAAAGFSQSFAGLWLALVLGIATAYFVLAVQFNSFVHPLSVLIALPFSITGALLALRIGDLSINLYSFIGLIVLMGIAKKNSIMIVEFTHQLRERDPARPVLEAVCEAASVRLRPILMTSAATLGAALPLLIGNSFGSEVRAPMGVTIVGGTLLSTLLTLIVVPALYLILVPLERNKPAH